MIPQAKYNEVYRELQDWVRDRSSQELSRHLASIAETAQGMYRYRNFIVLYYSLLYRVIKQELSERLARENLHNQIGYDF